MFITGNEDYFLFGLLYHFVSPERIFIMQKGPPGLDFSDKRTIAIELNGIYYWIIANWTIIKHFNCSDPLEGGGTIYSTGFFFVPWIFAARYIHRRELRMVSLESSSSVEYGIKKIFSIFDFYRELSRFKVLRKEEWLHVVFIHIFRNFCLNFRQFR